MKYKVVANQTVMVENVTAIKALNTVCGLMQGNTEAMRVNIYYLAKDGTWKKENSFQVYC